MRIAAKPFALVIVAGCFLLLPRPEASRPAAQGSYEPEIGHAQQEMVRRVSTQQTELLRAQLQELITVLDGMAYLTQDTYASALLAQAQDALDVLTHEDLAPVAARGIDYSYLILTAQSALHTIQVNGDPQAAAGNSCTPVEGDLPAASYSFFCGSERENTDVLLGIQIIFQVADAAISAASRPCDQVVVAAGFGGNASLVCLVLDLAYAAAKAIFDNVLFCDDDVDSAEVEGAYERACFISNQVVGVQGAVDMLGDEITLIRNVEIEEALYENRDVASLYLPGQFGGQLEAVSALVNDLFDRQTQAGIPTHGADFFLDEADLEYAKGDWLQAYRHLKKAYRLITEKE